ncbi:MAG: hypothetical protein MI866_09425 [Bacteroidales bacterium]|nr:hypothetical protein [Bacteroidales bacterium]
MKQQMHIILVAITGLFFIAEGLSDAKEAFRFKTDMKHGSKITLWLQTSANSDCTVKVEQSVFVSKLDANTFTQIDVIVKQDKDIVVYCNPNEIKGLIIEDSQLSQIDLSRLRNINQLFLNNNNLISINLRYNPQLQSLGLANNKLKNLDVTKNNQLTDLWLAGNSLSTIRMGELKLLRDLHCADNHLKSLNIQAMPRLHALYCDNNEIDSLDLSPATKLTIVDCSSNNISTLQLSEHPKMTYLKVDQTTRLPDTLKAKKLLVCK